MKYQTPLVALAVFSIVILLAQNNLPMVWAVSTANVTFTAGTTTDDVDYESQVPGSDTSTAYIIGQNGGQAFAWKKSATTQTILFNVTLTGSGSARAIEYDPDTFVVIAVTNDKIYRLSQSLGIAGSLATGTANVIQNLEYDNTNDIMYYCYNDGYGSINTSTMVPTTLYTDPGANTILDCAFDIPNNRAVLVGNNMGSGSAFEIITVDLTSHTFIQGASIGADLFSGVCVDDVEGNYWAMDSSNARVKKYTTALALSATVTVGTTPRNCSINTDETGRRLYVANEGSNTVSILDIDNNIVITSPAVCDTVTDKKIATKRLSNTTNTFVTCNSNVNTVIIDDTVSEFQPTPSADGCDNPANANLLRCRLGDDDGLGNLGDEVGNGIIDLGCNVIFVDCDESEDPATNGLGLLIFIASIFVVVGMFYYTIGKDAFHMPIFIYIIIIIALSAFFTITGIIDPVFLILSIVAVIALAVPKIIGVVRGTGTFGGGSTA